MESKYQIRLRNSFTIWHHLYNIRFLRPWVIRARWYKVAATCHVWERNKETKQWEYSSVKWRIVDLIKSQP